METLGGCWPVIFVCYEGMHNAEDWFDLRVTWPGFCEVIVKDGLYNIHSGRMYS